MKKIKITMVGLLVLVFIFGGALSGCGSNDGAAEEDVIPTDEAISEEPEYRKVGTEGEQAFKVIFENSTGQDITGITIKPSDEKKYPDNMIAAGEDPIKIDEKFQLFYTPADTGENSESAEQVQTDPDDPNTAVEFESLYDIKVTFADNSDLKLYDFSFNDIEEAKLLLSDGVLYIEYTSKSTGELVNTKEAQLAEKENQDKKKADKEAKKKAAEEEARQAEKAEKATPEEKPAQNSDECLDENIDWN